MTCRFKRLWVWNALFLAAVVLCSEGRCIGAPVQTDTLTLVLAELRSVQWEQRFEAFNRLLWLADPDAPRGVSEDPLSLLQKLMKKFSLREDEIRLGLIHLLETENQKEHAAAVGSLSEGYLEYRGVLIGVVASLRDRRAIRLLMDDLLDGDGAIGAIAALGDEVLDALIKRMSDHDMSMRAVATITVSQMIEPTQQPQLGAVSRAKVKWALVKQTKDSYYLVRISALQGLAKFPGDDVTAILESIARSDPFSRPGDTGQPANFPVRNAARVALSKRAKGH